MKPRARGKTTQEALEGFGWRAQHAGSGASREGTSKHMRTSRSEAPDYSSNPKTPTGSTNTPASTSTALIWKGQWMITRHIHQTLHGKGTLTPHGKEPRNYTLSAEMLATLAATGIAVQGRLQPRITITDRSENRSLALHRKKKLQQPATSERQL
ncbi:hypothetical protein DY000_02029824 [Brassica cretica]|uniref:Uncharacterized protein n=1 Tax=Brassica cretica TaxID=69181 RepID=A0ABQ7DDY9_BRACR|nr:hypothetical protein DY000_02029824 [Brassica cretica]